MINAALERGTTTLSCYLRPTVLDLTGVIVIVWKADTTACDSLNLSFLSICMFSSKKRSEREDIDLEKDFSAIG